MGFSDQSTVVIFVQNNTSKIMATKILIQPGYSGSDTDHWQTHWERESTHFERITQRDWLHPRAEEWADTIEKYVKGRTEEIIVVAHSMGCLALAYWAQRTKLRIKGALLVAPPDIENSRIKPHIEGFERIKPQPLPFRSILVASRNDEYISLEKAEELANTWGCEFVDIGEKGHINSNSNIGNWPEGKAYLYKLLA
jgi:uncharacterized protein